MEKVFKLLVEREVVLSDGFVLWDRMAEAGKAFYSYDWQDCKFPRHQLKSPDKSCLLLGAHLYLAILFFGLGEVWKDQISIVFKKMNRVNRC